VVLPATIAPLALHVHNHAKKLTHIAIQELVVIFDHAFQILHMLPHRLRGLETFMDRRVGLRDEVTASRTTRRMHPKRVIITRVSTVATTVVAIIIVVLSSSLQPQLGPSGVFSLGTSSQMYKSLSCLPATAHELGLRSSE
jgi:hypothetical protein